MTVKRLDPRKLLHICRQGSKSYSRRCFSSPGFRFSLFAILAAFFIVPFAAGPVDAAFVTLKEAEMDAIYGQTSFGANPVDIRYLPTVTHEDASLLNIDSASKWATLTGLFNSATIHYAYYVDAIDYCGGSFNTGIVGCGDLPGDDYVIESVYAGSANGAELMAHELGHNLALGHDGLSYDNNLMDPVVGNLPGSPQTTTLTPVQAANILSHTSVQTDVLGKFIQIQPVLIVPEPTTLVLALGFLGVSTFGCRQRLS